MLNMLLDFNEIPRSGGDAFEAFAYEFLQIYGYQADTPPSFGPDGGRDCIVRDPPFGLAQQGRRWLVSCKHTQARVGVGDDRADHPKLSQFRCDGFILVYSNVMTSGLQESYEALKRQYGAPYGYFGPYELEESIVPNVKYAWLIRRFMPQSFERIYAVRDAMMNDCCLSFNADLDNRYAIIWPDRFGSNNIAPCCDYCKSYVINYPESSGDQYTCVLMQQAQRLD